MGSVGKSMSDEFEVSASRLRRRCGFAPEVAMVLGSGLSSLADELDEAVTVPYDELPGMAVSTAPGHRSEAVAGRLSGRGVLLLRGRFHAYEGYAFEQVVAPVRLVAALGCSRLLLTNAAGGVNQGYCPGDLMAIDDHINLTGMSPLRGLVFPSGRAAGAGERSTAAAGTVTEVRWPLEMRRALKAAAATSNVRLQEGVYGWTSGPSFETPAEIRMARALGADAVGMSTVPEALAAARLGVRTAGLSLISNMAAGILEQPITAEEVMETARAAREKLLRLLRAFLERLTEEG